MRLNRRNVVVGVGGALASGVAAVAVIGAGRPGAATHGRSPTRGRGKWTAFGSVAVLGSARRQRSGGAGAAHSGHDAHAAHLGPHTASEHGTWTQEVVVTVEVHNGLDRTLLFSPGQFRLRLGSDGPTVSPYDTGRPPLSLPARSTTRTWISYLAPDDAADLSVDFTEAGAGEAMSTALTPTGTSGALS